MTVDPQTSIKEQLIETWHINNRVNLQLIDAISEEGLHCTLSPRGGGTPAKQFAHIHNIRFWKLERLAGDLAENQTKISLSDDIDKDLLRRILIGSADAVAALLKRGIEKEGKIKGFKRGAITLLGYFISHESHHRGNILLTLKQCGHGLPKSVSYGIWDWDKI